MCEPSSRCFRGWIQPHDEQSLLSEVEQATVARMECDGYRVHSRDKCLHELFEEQVERSGDAVAVVYEEDQFELCRTEPTC